MCVVGVPAGDDSSPSLPSTSDCFTAPELYRRPHVLPPLPCPCPSLLLLLLAAVYLVDRVIPMLPRLLCEELCSLNPGVDRLAFSVVWDMTADGDIR